jgi:hypothetical protein
MLDAAGLLSSGIARRRLAGLRTAAAFFAMFLLRSRCAAGSRRMATGGWKVLLAGLRRRRLRLPWRLRALRLRMRRCGCGRWMLLRPLLSGRFGVTLLRLDLTLRRRLDLTLLWLRRLDLMLLRRLDVALLSLSRRMRLRRLVRRSALRGAAGWRFGLRPGLRFFLARLVVLRLLRLTRPRLRETLCLGRRTLHMQSG